MRTLVTSSVLVLLVSGATAAASTAATLTAEGVVVDVSSHWESGGDTIVTQVVIQRDDGSRVTLRQAGGTVDGIGMRQFPSPQLLRVGDAVTARAERTSAARVWWLVGVGVRSRADRRDRSAPTDRPPPPLGFTRTTNDTGAQLYWSSACVFITYDQPGTTHLTTEFEVMDNVFARWRNDTQSCSYLEFVSNQPTAMETRFDRINVIKFRDDLWCRPAMDDKPQQCYDEAAAALTTLFFIDDLESDRNGEILDADIEFNAVHFSISNNGNTLGGAACMSDLASTLTHEVGHLMGLDHTCFIGVGERPVDNNGDPSPSCGMALPPEITEATMYNFQSCGETKKASPEADDIAGICAIYPSASDPGTCEPVKEPGGCCSVGASKSSLASRTLPALALAWLLVMAILAPARRRRRARRAA